MNIWSISRDPSGVKTLLDVGAEHGVNPAALLRDTRLVMSQLEDPDVVISGVQELKVIANLLHNLGHPPGLGLAVGLRCHFSSFGMWGYGLVSSATLEEAVDKALHFLDLTFAYSAIKKVIQDEEVLLTFSPPDLSPGLKRFVVEREMGTALALLQDVGGVRFRLSGFHLRRGNGRIYTVPKEFQNLCGTRTNLDAADYFLTFPTKWLNFKPPAANPITATMCERTCKRLLERRRLKSPLSELIKEYASGSSFSGMLTLGSICNLTNITARTLKRRLQREGQSFRPLVADARSQLAAKLVLDANQSMSEISERLGYSSPSCFSQAFKRWYGVSPSMFRKQAIDVRCEISSDQ